MDEARRIAANIAKHALPGLPLNLTIVDSRGSAGRVLLKSDGAFSCH
jgi:hypothetical protein